MNVELAMRAALVLAALVATAVGVWLDRSSRRHRDRDRAARGPAAARAAPRRRFLLGVPWGSLTTVAVVVAVYLFVQGGLAHWYNPVVIPFRAWSYFAPLGILTAGVTHAGPGHLLGNVFATLVFAPLAEYVWGHFPDRRGAEAFGSLRTNPYVRAFVLFPAAALAVAVLTAAFAVGPVIGFSAVVFAFAGAGLLYRPFTAVVALSASNVVDVAYSALQNPVTVASGRAAYITPWWSNIAIQGHALGLLTGVLLAGWLAARRGDDLPRPRRLLVGTVVFAVSQSLWAVYWFRGGETYVLYRAVGLTLVVGLAVLVAAFAAGRDADPVETLRAAAASPTPRRVAVALMLVSTAALAGPAIPVNLYAVDDEPLPGDPVEVRGYQVTYAENVEDGMVSVVDVSAFGETTTVNTSGVIVRNPDRAVWTTAVTKGRLAFAGEATVVVGGLGWRETVTATRRGWTPVGNATVYRVRVRHGSVGRVAYVSPNATAEPRIGGRTVTVAANRSGFSLVVAGGADGVDTAVAPIPEQNETVTAGGLRFVRDGRAVFAVTADNETRVRVANRETYRGN
ncbi:rhomboid family intramembrane serine protease [Halobaculum sp. P14]|uniref:rhomboid family intramembrane serine protease n=1 Tax=Halobaculum sp. P14 TaxID=3421638 RepID=UPI003EB84793